MATTPLTSVNLTADMLRGDEFTKISKDTLSLHPNQVLLGVVGATRFYDPSETKGLNKWSFAMNVDNELKQLTIERGLILIQGYTIINDAPMTFDLPDGYETANCYVGITLDNNIKGTYTGTPDTGDYKPREPQIKVAISMDVTKVKAWQGNTLVPPQNNACVFLGTIESGIMTEEQHDGFTYLPINPWKRGGSMLQSFTYDSYTAPPTVSTTPVFMTLVKSGIAQLPKSAHDVLNVLDNGTQFNFNNEGLYKVTFKATCTYASNTASAVIGSVDAVIKRQTSPDGRQRAEIYRIDRSNTVKAGVSKVHMSGTVIMQALRNDKLCIRLAETAMNGATFTNIALQVEFIENSLYQYNVTTNDDYIPYY